MSYKHSSNGLVWVNGIVKCLCCDQEWFPKLTESENRLCKTEEKCGHPKSWKCDKCFPEMLEESDMPTQKKDTCEKCGIDHPMGTRCLEYTVEDGMVIKYMSHGEKNLRPENLEYWMKLRTSAQENIDMIIIENLKKK